MPHIHIPKIHVHWKRITWDDTEQGRLMYIAEAALEYLISILVAGSYLATLTRELGISDSLTGVLSSVISLGCLFQLLSVTYRRRRVKGFVVGMSILNQLLFLLLYVIPLTGVAKPIKSALFVVFLVLAYVIYNFAHPKKISWLMSLVDDHHRGSFTANKEIVSLIAGMVFTYGMGTLIDHFAALGRIRTAFVLSAAVIFVLMVLHTLSMIFTIEPPMAEAPKKDLRKSMADVLQNRQMLRVIVIFLLYQTAAGLATPFFGTYQINELGFDLQFISLLTIGSSVVRIFVSRLWGKYADRTSFLNLMEKCLLVLAAGTLSAALAVPSNGMIMFTLYYLFNGIAMGGLNSALINLVFDYAAPAQRADSLAICQAFSGLAGFLVTLGASVPVAAIQQNGNAVFGISLYAQQVMSFGALFFILLTILYVRHIRRTEKKSAS